MGSEQLNSSNGPAAELRTRARRNEELNQRLRQRQPASPPDGRSGPKMDPVRIAKGLGFQLYSRSRADLPHPWGWNAPAGGFALRIMPEGSFGFSTEESAAENALVSLQQALGEFTRQRSVQAVPR